MEDVDEALLGLVQLDDAVRPLVGLLGVGAAAAGAVEEAVAEALARLVVEGRVADYGGARERRERGARERRE